MISLLQASFDQVMAQPGFREIPERCLRKLLLPGHEVAVVFSEGHPGLAQEREVSLAEVNCHPLGLMVEGSGVEGSKGGQTARNKQWLAVVGRDYLSLRSENGGAENVLRVEAMLGGHVDFDFVFVYAGCHHDLRNKLPAGLRIEATTRGQLGWTYDITENELEAALVGLGGVIFDQGSEGSSIGPQR